MRICHFDALDSAGCTKIQLPHVPRSIMAWSFSASNDQVHLLIGTGHGQLVSLKLNYTKVLSIDMSSRRSISLGDRPVSLQRCAVDGRTVVMATGGRTIIMSWSNGRIAQHHVNVKVRRPLEIASCLVWLTTCISGSGNSRGPEQLSISQRTCL